MMPRGRRVLSMGDDPRDQSSSNSLPVPNDPAAAAVRFDPPSAAMTALALLLVFFFVGFFSVFARRCFADIHAADRRRPPTLNRYHVGGSIFAPSYPSSGLDPSEIRSLPLLSYTAGGGAAAATAGCVVCLSEFEEKESVKVIPACGHVFHPDCIDAWLVSRGSCPICRCSEMFGSGFRVGEISVDIFRASDDGAGEEFGAEAGGGEGKAVGLGRSRSWCSRAGDERKLFLRRTCSV